MEGKVDAAFRSTIASAVQGAAAFLPDGIAVRIAGLTKEFAIGDESVVAVLDLDLSVRDGVLCIVGPSGCGKFDPHQNRGGLRFRLQDDLVSPR